MAKRCDICGRGALVGHRRSHSNIATLVKRKVNLQSKTIAGRKRKICTTCIRAGKAL